MMIASISLGPGGQEIEISGFTAEEMGVPLVEVRIDRHKLQVFNLTPDQAIEIAAALVTASQRARQEILRA